MVPAGRRVGLGREGCTMKPHTVTMTRSSNISDEEATQRLGRAYSVLFSLVRGTANGEGKVGSPIPLAMNDAPASTSHGGPAARPVRQEATSDA